MTALATQDLGLQSHIGTLHVQFSTDVGFSIFLFFYPLARNQNWWDIEKLPHQPEIFGCLVSLTSNVDRQGSVWDALHLEIKGWHRAQYAQ